jgi:hypothetical protein
MSLVAGPIPSANLYKKYIFVQPYETNTTKGLKKFAVGDTVEGMIVQSKPKIRIIPSITTKDGFMVPLSVVKEAPVVEVPEDKDAIGKGKEVINTTAFRNGAVVGAIGGAAYGFFQNKNMFYSALVGMVVGGAVGYVVGGKKSDKKK